MNRFRKLSSNVTRIPNIIPKWQNGYSYPKKYEIDCSSINLFEHSEKAHTFIQDAKEVFDKFGIAHLKNTNLTEKRENSMLSTIASYIMNGMSTYTSGANSRNNLYKNVYDTGAPLSAHVHYHHELAYVKQSVKSLALFCNKSKWNEETANRGSTYLSNSEAASSSVLKTEFGKKLFEKGILYIRCLTDREYINTAERSLPIYNHWQDSFETNDVQEAEKIARSRGLHVEWNKDTRFMITTFHAHAFEYFPLLNKNMLFTSIADDAIWFDRWPGMMHQEAIGNLRNACETDRPLKMMWGDHTELSREDIQNFVDMYDDYGMKIDWEEGDLLFICNYRFVHGRPAYFLEKEEVRDLHVILGAPLHRQGQI